MYILEVMIEHPVRHLDMCFSYLSEAAIKVGVRVHVPLGKQRVVGYVTHITSTSLSQMELQKRDGITYRLVDDVIDEQPLLTPELEKLSTALAKMTLTPLISCLKTMLPPSLKPSSSAKMTQKVEKVVVYQNMPNNLTKKQAECLTFLKAHPSLPLKEIPYSAALINNLKNKGAIEVVTHVKRREVKAYQKIHDRQVELNAEQQQVLQALFSWDRHKPFLLYGITGSGKTEVYLQAAKKMLGRGKQVLMLVPEISLTPKMVALFQARFGSQVAILHSRLSDGQRYDEYQRILKQEVGIVVGARSAVFAPLDHIGLIILDEEHDQSYKQNNSPRYHTRDMALWRARYHEAIVLFGSASPSIESYAKAQKGLYHLLTMKKRATSLPLPDCVVVDMAKEAEVGNLSIFSRAFIDGLTHCLAQGQQALVLVNRRGYASYLMCKDCGYIPKCPHCDVTMTYHKKQGVLRCHYCGYEELYQKQCPNCQSQLVSYRGTGTEKCEELLAERFKQARIIRYDMDTTKGKNGHEKLLAAFENKEADILLGTQMIAKGLDFPNVRFVGVLDGDGALNLPDFRSAERTFQLLLQVAGRAGRHQRGNVVIQTYNPHHYAIVAAAQQDYEGFFKEELNMRQLAHYPPFCYLASILFSGKRESDVASCAKQFAGYLKHELEEAQVLGPAPAMISRISDAYRYRILLKYRHSSKTLQVLETALKNYHGKIKIEIDVNPYTQM